MSQTKAQLLDNIKDNVQLDARNSLRFADTDSSHYVAFKAPATVSSNVTWTLPAADGSANYVLATDGSGTLSWIADPAGQWTTSGSNIYFTGGNVGIGDSSPSNPLSVTGASAFDGDVTFTGASYNVTWDKSVDDLIFNDNAKAAFGTSSDLQIYHDGSNSYLKNAGTGNIIFLSDDVQFKSDGGGNTGLTINTDGAVELYHNNAEKLNTVTDGVNITGSLQFADDTNTYLQRSAADTLQLVTGGTAALTVDASQEVGIGTTGPTTILDVRDTSTTAYPFTSADSGVYSYTPYAHELNLRNNTAGTDDGFAGIHFHAGERAAGGRQGTARISALYTGEYKADLVFGTRNTSFAERMRITAAGNVGIGTASPSKKLDVSGDLHVSAQMLNERGTASAPPFSFTDDTDTGMFNISNADLGFSVGGTERMRIDSSGQVRLNTAGAPAADLHVGGTGSALNAYFQTSRSSGAYHHYAIGNSGASLGYIGSAGQISGSGGGTSFAVRSEGDLQFCAGGGTERLRIDSSGNASIGGIAPVPTDAAYNKALLHIHQTQSGTYGSEIHLTNAATGSAAGDGMFLSMWTDNDVYFTNQEAGDINFSTNGSEKFRIGSYGETKVSCNKAGDYALNAFNDGANTNRYGILIQCGADDAAGTNYALGVADGNGTTQGYLTFTGGTLSLVAFTASHPCIIPDADNPSDNSMAYPYGTLLETISIQYSKNKKDGSDTERGIRYKVQKTQSANSRKVLGAYAGSMNGGPEGQTNEHDAYVLGDGHILVNNAGGNIEVGDGICSSATAGIGQKATANPSMIIGIAQEAITFTGSETKLVAVQYGLQQFTPWS